MNMTTFLQNQFSNIQVNYQSIAGDLTDQEWVCRPAPGQNMLGYTAWHIPRTQDFIIQSWIRGLPEVAHSDRWTCWRSLKRLGFGAGIPLAGADEIARTVRRVDVLAYMSAVLQEIMAWLQEMDDTDLDQIPDPARHFSSFPEYQTPEFHEEADDLLNQPVWLLLMRPSIGHVYRHLGELESIKSILRTSY